MDVVWIFERFMLAGNLHEQVFDAAAAALGNGIIGGVEEPKSYQNLAPRVVA